MNDLLTVIEIIALLSLTLLCLYLVTVLVRLKKTLGEVEKDVKDISTRVVPILENTEYVTTRLKSIAESIDDQVLTVRDSIASIRQVADNIVELERRVQDRIEGPLLEGISFASAVVRGIRTFAERIRS
ncbi:MAG TPA: DUF948 domain-containing protein [Bacteroidota bacterium]|nr:DUF948 domain-containing protein [Bacteroidota bacterium]